MAMTLDQEVAEALAVLQRNLGLSPTELAGGLGVTTRTLDRWRKGEAFPNREARGRLAELTAVQDHIFETFYDYDVADWMRHANYSLAGMSPAEAISAGRIDQVEAALVVVDYGIYV